MLYDVLSDEVLDPPEQHRLPKLYLAACEDGDEPRPECAGFRFGRKEGWRDTMRIVAESLKPTELARHLDPQYTFGYYNGVLSALRGWAHRFETIGPKQAELPFDRDDEASPAMARATEADAAKTTTESAGDAQRPSSKDASVRERQLLERTIELLCDHIGLLIREARGLRRLGTREMSLQLDVFRERKASALALCATQSDEPWEIRVVRYERLVAALECSRSFFSAALSSAVLSVAGD